MQRYTLRNFERLQFADQTIDISGAVINVAPEAVAIAGATVNEFAANGTVVGTLSSVDGDGDPVTFEFAGGGTTFGAFQIVGSELRVLNGVAID